ncbi:MAG TPA: HAD family hydrolase [Terriglobales bacterium]|nr:HAD family hydrolase [Terriglobales bacterium]
MTMESRFENRQTLLIDLDDTLCENNIYFERAIAEFITFLDHKEHSRDQVRQVLNQVERECIAKHGYGLHSFAHSLVDCFERLAVVPVTPELHQTISGFAHKIAEHPMEIIAGVPETLEYLAARHHLIVMTKGNITEQTGKIARSGLKGFFSAVEVVAEKNVPTYKEIVEKYALVREETWMIGNSPKSDINPALGAGIHAIFIPHDQTWVLEHEELSPAPSNGQKLLTLERFANLRDLF